MIKYILIFLIFLVIMILFKNNIFLKKIENFSNNTINIKNLKKNKEKIYLGDISKLKFKSVAIVGSGGILLKYEKGKNIDSKDAVFRFNEAPVFGFEKYIGSKTTFRSSYGITCGRFAQKESIICFHENKEAKKSWEIYYKYFLRNKIIK